MEITIIWFSDKTHTTRKNGIFSQRQKNTWPKNHSFPEENEDHEEKCKIIYCDNVGKNKTLEEKGAKKEKLTLNLGHQALHSKMS